jgi:hypothetical protein
LQTSCWTTTVPSSVRKIAPVGQTSRQAACVQCLQTSDDMSQRKPSPSTAPPSGASVGPPSAIRIGASCSTKATCRHEFALSSRVLS